MTDTRIVYGMRCSWWDSIQKVGHTPPNPARENVSIPCCPHCGSVLFEVADEATWFAAVDVHDRLHHGYRAMVEWGRGRCFPNYERLRESYEETKA